MQKLNILSTSDYFASESEVDCMYFGLRSAKVILYNPINSKYDQESLIKFMDIFDFVTITNKGNHPENCIWIGLETNAFLTDLNIQLLKPISKINENEITEAIISDDYPYDGNIIRIAQTSFKYSRFLNDPFLPQDEAKYIYADITQNAFNKDGRYFCVIKEVNEIAGFSLFSFSNDNSIIELIAIDTNHQGRKIGKNIINNIERFSSHSGRKYIQVGTQLNNLTAIKFYLSIGFLPDEVNSIYHYWPSKKVK